MGLLHAGRVRVSELLRASQEHRSHQQSEIHPSRSLELLWGGGKLHPALLTNTIPASLLEEWDKSILGLLWLVCGLFEGEGVVCISYDGYGKEMSKALNLWKLSQRKESKVVFVRLFGVS